MTTFTVFDLSRTRWLVLAVLGVLAVLSFAPQARASQLEELVALSSDVAKAADGFYRAAQASVPPGQHRDRLIRAAADLRSGAAQLRDHLGTRPDVDTINRDLEGIDRARDGVERWVSAARAPAGVVDQWRFVRDKLDSLFQLASGGDGQPGEAPEAGPPPAPPPASAVTKVNLMGVTDYRYAAGDLIAQLDRLAGAVQRRRGREPRSGATLERLAALRSQAEALAQMQDLAAMRETASQFAGLISGIDASLSKLRAYPDYRPLWVAARATAMGIHRTLR